MKIIIAITEDKYGCSAIAELIRKLEENKKIENEIKLDCHFKIVILYFINELIL